MCMWCSFCLPIRGLVPVSPSRRPFDTHFSSVSGGSNGSDIEVWSNQATDLSESATADCPKNEGPFVSAEFPLQLSWWKNTTLREWVRESSGCMDVVSEWLHSSSLKTFIKFTAEVLERKTNPFDVNKMRQKSHVVHIENVRRSGQHSSIGRLIKWNTLHLSSLCGHSM